MDCKQVIEKLLDLVEGDVSPEVRDAIQAHLAECERCRSEYERVQVARDAMRVAVQALAPRRKYATQERIAAIMDGAREVDKHTRILSIRRFVAAAAAAAILVSVPFIVQDIREMWTPADSEGTGSIAVLPVPVEHVLLASDDDQSGGLRTVSPVRMQTAGTGQEAARSRIQLAAIDTEGVRVPVDHDYYDAEEAALWW